LGPGLVRGGRRGLTAVFPAAAAAAAAAEEEEREKRGESGIRDK
jgi:hypothetical protein